MAACYSAFSAAPREAGLDLVSERGARGGAESAEVGGRWTDDGGQTTRPLMGTNGRRGRVGTGAAGCRAKRRAAEMLAAGWLLAVLRELLP